MADSNKNSTRAGAGFTLIEAMIATLPLAVAIIALMFSNQAFTLVNSAGIELATA